MFQISFLYNLNFIARRHFFLFKKDISFFIFSFFVQSFILHMKILRHRKEDIYPTSLGSVVRTKLNSGLLCILVQNDFPVEGQESFVHTSIYKST